MSRHNGLVQELWVDNVSALVVEELLDNQGLVICTESSEIVGFVDIIL